jgi:hypothetical protein
MAESPAGWDLLTASIAVSDLTEPFSAWAFLVLQGLVRDAPGDRDLFARAVREESAQEITGPTAARRVAIRLSRAGIALESGQAPDRWGKVAAQRLQGVESWTGGRRARDYLEHLRTAGL